MRDQLVEYLSTCISFDSIEEKPKQKQECMDWITSVFLGEDLAHVIHGKIKECPYVYVPNPHAEFLWFAHVDVVPALPEQFVLRIEGDSAYGRGVKDMKGAALSFLIAYAEARAKGEHPKVSILLTSDEEIGGSTIPTLLDQGIVHANAAFTPDSGSDPWIVTEHKGVVWGDLTASGQGGHGSMPWESTNPIPLLMKALEILAKEFPSGTETDWQITVTPTQLEGSDARNKIPDVARCGLDIRYPKSICNSEKEVLSLIQKVLPEGCVVSAARSASPHWTDPNHPLVQLFKDTAELVIGKNVEIGKEHGGTDARYFGERNIPAFLYGPEGGNLHGANEWVSVSSLQKHIDLYTTLFSRL